MIHSGIGWIHLLSAGVSLLLGTIVLFSTKGTRFHKRVGYGYVVAMLTLNVTAFCIYRLFGGFGPFHIAAIISLLTLLAGIIPAVLRKPAHWLDLHFAFMYYSVIGLYAAFVSETIVRIPGVNFGLMVGVGTTVVMAVGMTVFYWKRADWKRLSTVHKSTSRQKPIN